MAVDSGNPMDAMMDIFMAETNDFLSKIEDILLQNEQSGEGLRAATPEIFRIMHTIKSSSAMMSLDHISKLAHKVEDLFYYLRENPDVPVDESKLIDIVLEAVDFIKRNLDGREREDPAPLIEKIGQYLEKVKNGEAAPESKPVKLVEPAQPAPKEEAPAQPEPKQGGGDDGSGGSLHSTTMTVWFKEDVPMLGLRSLEIRTRVGALAEELMSVPEDPTAHEDVVRENGLLLLAKSSKTTGELVALIQKSPFVGRVEATGGAPEAAAPKAEPVPVVKPAPVPEPKPEPEAQPFVERRSDRRGGGDRRADRGGEDGAPVHQFIERRRDAVGYGKTFINVETTKLDTLVDLVGETQILQMELAQDLEHKELDKADNALVKLKKLILSLQEAALSTRMIPVRETFLKMNRLVRDIARRQEKDIQFITTGEDTEVDRGIIDHITSPLMHIIRNAVDHGIEDAEARVAMGKPAAGRVELSASAEGRNIIISVTDDGKGLDRERILAKALDVGLVTEMQAATMTREEVNALVFLPGFSTNTEVTEYSGRGVGMDVVNENLKKMNGKVIVQSEPGKGTKVIMKIPLTLAIIDTILLRVGTEMCAVPVSSVEQFLYLDAKESVRYVNGEDVVMMDGECFRILNLFDFYTYTPRIPYEDGVMIVIEGDARRYVIFASEVIDRQDVVVKPAPSLFKSVKGISGCTILGDGRISLILDTDELLSGKQEVRR